MKAIADTVRNERKKQKPPEQNGPQSQSSNQMDTKPGGIRNNNIKKHRKP
jgi:hypothetical protein